MDGVDAQRARIGDDRAEQAVTLRQMPDGRVVIVGEPVGDEPLEAVTLLVQDALDRYSLVADHWQYLAMPGVLVLMAGVGAWLVERYYLRGKS